MRRLHCARERSFVPLFKGSGKCIAVFLLCLTACGCVKHSILVSVNKDGSGFVTVTSAVAAGSAGSSVTVNGESPKAKPFPDEDKLKALLARISPQLKFVKAEEYATDSARGWAAGVAFREAPARISPVCSVW